MTRAAIIGGGMSGILAAIRCDQRGIESTLYEKATRLGGDFSASASEMHRYMYKTVTPNQLI